MKRFMLLAVTLCISVAAMGQQRSESRIYWTVASKASVVLSQNVDKQFTMGENEIALGYNFNDKLSVYVPFSAGMALYPKYKTYSEFSFLGLGGRYNLCQKGLERYSVVTSVQKSLGKNDWGGAMSYELSLVQEYGNLYLSAGVKYFDAAYTHVQDRWCLAASVGLRFGVGK